jgi:ubiquinone biosynthesis protein COQ4
MTPKEAVLLGKAIAITLNDSERTEQIHIAEELTSRARLRGFLAAHRDDPELRALLADRPELCSAQVDFDALRALPPATFGYQYIHHLDGNGLTADTQAAPTHHVSDPEVAYLVRRFRQTHDVWHALTNLGTAGHEEVIIHAFSWGQLRLPVSAMVVFFGSLKHIVLEGRWHALRHDLRDAYLSGRDAAPLLSVYWERLWDEPIDSVRARYGIRPCA